MLYSLEDQRLGWAKAFPKQIVVVEIMGIDSVYAGFYATLTPDHLE